MTIDFNALIQNNGFYKILGTIDSKLIDIVNKLFNDIDIDDTGIDKYGDVDKEYTVVYQAQVYHFMLEGKLPKQIPLTDDEWELLKNNLIREITFPYTEDEKYEYEVLFEYDYTTLKIIFRKEEKLL